MQQICSLIFILIVTNQTPNYRSNKHLQQSSKVGGFSTNLGFSQQVQDMVDQLTDDINISIEQQFGDQQQEQEYNQYTVINYQTKLVQGNSYKVIIQDINHNRYLVYIHSQLDQQPQLKSIQKVYKQYQIQQETRRLRRNRKNRLRN